MHRQVRLGRTVALVPVAVTRLPEGLWTHAACRPSAVALANLLGRLSQVSVRPFGSGVVDWHPPVSDDDWEGWTKAAGRALGTDVASAIVLRPGVAHRRRFIAILLSQGHRQVGFAKWTLNPPNRLALAAEKLLSEDPPETFTIPRLIDFGAIDGWTWSLNAMVPPGPHGPASLDAETRRAIIREIRGRLADLSDTGGVSHGDFAPWNVRSVQGRTYVLDWEDVRQAPEATDEVWHVVTGCLSTGTTVETTFERVLSELSHHPRSAIAEAALFLRRRETEEPPEADDRISRSPGLLRFERDISRVLQTLQDAPAPA